MGESLINNRAGDKTLPTYGGRYDDNIQNSYGRIGDGNVLLSADTVLPVDRNPSPWMGRGATLIASLFLCGQSNTMTAQNQTNEMLDVSRKPCTHDSGVRLLSVFRASALAFFCFSICSYSDCSKTFIADIRDLNLRTNDSHSLGLRSIFFCSCKSCGSHKGRDNTHVRHDIG